MDSITQLLLTAFALLLGLGVLHIMVQLDNLTAAVAAVVAARKSDATAIATLKTELAAAQANAVDPAAVQALTDQLNAANAPLA